MSKHRKIRKAKSNRCIICRAVADWPDNGKFPNYKPLCNWCADNVSAGIVEVASGYRPYLRTSSSETYTPDNWVSYPDVIRAKYRRHK